MKEAPLRKARSRQRGRSYGPEVDDVIRVVAETLDYICAERLTPALAPTVRLLVAHGELMVAEPVLAQLERISVRTVKRIVRRAWMCAAAAAWRSGADHASAGRRIPWTSLKPGAR
jgi:hypothetical protein